ncbi:MAG: GNAT family N-acetyltransferase [Planctomycetota bacterium]
MTVTLRPITEENWTVATGLGVRGDQEGLVASNLYSIAEWKFWPDAIAKGIFADETMVGFILWGEIKSAWWICRLMVDGPYQGQGYAREAIGLAVREMLAANADAEIRVCLLPRNDRARKVYESVGFTDTGEIDDGELVFRLAD